MSPVQTDTNIVLRAAEPSHPLNTVVIDAQIALRNQGFEPCLVAQNLVEFRAVATRPRAANGLGDDPTASRRRDRQTS